MIGWLGSPDAIRNQAVGIALAAAAIYLLGIFMGCGRKATLQVMAVMALMGLAVLFLTHETGTVWFR